MYLIKTKNQSLNTYYPINFYAINEEIEFLLGNL